jgi:MinD superfamily P-loop ATPase
MKKIGITGIKGGVGKSTIAVLLANQFRKEGKKVVLADTDVECPNDHLLLGEKLKKPREKVYAQFPKLDKTRCQKCGLCLKNCRSNAIFQAPGKYPLFLHELCSSCGLCWHLCPHQAIKIKKEMTGEIFENKINQNFYLVTGRSVGVVEETGPIVTPLKKAALKLAQKLKADYLLIDTAVGMHCGVIRALKDVDLAYAVTEPTPLGAHDLKLALKLLKTLQVPAQIILNLADLGPQKIIQEVAQKNKTKIRYQIPYSQKLFQAHLKGNLQNLNLLPN